MKKIFFLLLTTLTLTGCLEDESKKIENCADSYWARDNHFYKEDPDKVKNWEDKASFWGGSNSTKKKRPFGFY